MQPRAIYCMENEKCTLQEFDNSSNVNDQTPFVSSFPSPDSACDKLHLAKHRRLSVLDMFLLICTGYMHVILFVGKSWHGQIQVTVVLLGDRKLATAWEGGMELGWVEKRCGPPIGIWEALLRFIGGGILQAWGIIHGKASLSGSVYKMRLSWQRWRPLQRGRAAWTWG